MQKIFFLAIDISKHNITAYDGKKFFNFPNERFLPQFNTFFSKNFNKNFLVIIYEPTGPYSAFLEEFCALEKIKVVPLNSRKVPRLLEVLGHRAKTDGLEAKALYEYRKLISHKDIKTLELNKNFQKLAFLLSEYHFLKKQRINFLNYLETLKFNPWRDKESEKTIENMIFEINKRLKEKEEKIKKLIKKEADTKNKVEAIKNIEGIGFLTAVNLFLFFERKKIRNRKEAVALVGLDPIIYESGKGKIGCRISKQGDSYLRNLLYMAAMCAIRINERIKKFFVRLVHRGKPRKLALVV